MDATTLFAVLELEREPLRLTAIGTYIRNWLQDAGGFAAIGLVLFLAFTWRKSDSAWSTDQTRRRAWPVMALCAILALVAYGVAGFYYSKEPPLLQVPDPYNPLYPKFVRQDSDAGRAKDLAMVTAGAISLLGLCLPFLFDLARLKWRRVGALARLSFREAVRRKVLWALLVLLLLFLFPSKWFVQIKPEDEIRNAVSVIDFAMSVVLTFAFGLLAAFSIPADIKSQSMHTVVTKPVQRFEIVLGRFLGYLGLATAVLLGLRLFSMVMIMASRPTEAAKVESQQARVALYGDLEFNKRIVKGPEDWEFFRGVMRFEGESVGREWDYRKYVAGPDPADPTSHRAHFNFAQVPAKFADADVIPCEFAFDIFRTTKGRRENVGVMVGVWFVTAAWTMDRQADFKARLAKEGLELGRQVVPGTPQWQKWNDIAAEFGLFAYRGKEIFDYHTYQIPVPGGIFKSAREAPTIEGRPALSVIVICESPTQFLGVAKRDLYLLEGNYSFWWNYVKGAFGLWLMLALVIGLAVVLSTYLSGVVSWLLANFIVLCGFFRPFAQELAEGRVVGGGPTEALIRLATNQNIITPLDNTPGAKVAEVLDTGYQWLFRRLLNLFPDVEQFDWSAYVGEGFNIPVADMALSFIVLAGYLLPWLVAGYYLIKSREVAN